MGLFDRFRRKPDEVGETEQSFFLDADSSSSLGDVAFMRRSNTIRHTFPGTADSPGMKERIEEVASNENRLGNVSKGLPENPGTEATTRQDPGVPKAVKKTFAKQMSQSELENRLKGAAVMGTNVPGTASKGDVNAPAAPAAKPAPTGSTLNTGKPGSIDPFRKMVKELG
ncbi:MAG: hypothetical protein VKJ87_00395 [Synechococcus sp.]|nr:hypothetical protein [Synechococcus sp.]